MVTWLPCIVGVIRFLDLDLHNSYTKLSDNTAEVLTLTFHNRGRFLLRLEDPLESLENCALYISLYIQIKYTEILVKTIVVTLQLSQLAFQLLSALSLKLSNIQLKQSAACRYWTLPAWPSPKTI